MRPGTALSLPTWLVERLRRCGGRVPFRTYMAWVLHDPDHGVYGAGRLGIGPAGDFVTAPSMGPAFARLLLRQLRSWFDELAAGDPGPLSLIETGPGEGDLARQLAELLAGGDDRPPWAGRLELVLVEPNPGMARRQRQRLGGLPLPVRWCRFEELASEPRTGVVVAHEVLDALPVERIVSMGGRWHGQWVELVEGPPPRLHLGGGPALAAGEPARRCLEDLALPRPGAARPDGWCSEVHPALQPWLDQCRGILRQGHLLVIDYALDARRYYDPRRSGGTLTAYRRQRASPDPLAWPGEADLTAHLCGDTLERAAGRSGWHPEGQTSQGEALLALGLADDLHALQRSDPGTLARSLTEREQLLRLVDPHALGSFRWFAFGAGPAAAPPRFLQEPAGAGI